MSSAQNVPPPSQAGRRFHARRRIEGLAYVEFGPDNGAILIDLGEGGLGFQSVMPVMLNQALLFKFKLASEPNYIEGCAEVAWRNESGKGGGLRFVELSADACAQIRHWSGVLAAPETATAAARAEKSAEPNSVQESVTNQEAAGAAEESSSPVDRGHADQAENSEISPEVGISESSSAQVEELLAAVEAAEAAKAAEERFAAEQNALSPQPAIPEFTIDLVPASEPHEVTSSHSEWAASVASPSPRRAAAIDAPTAHETAIAAPPPAANAAKPARVAPFDSTSSTAGQRRQRRPVPATPEPPSVAHDEQRAFRESSTREAQKPARSAWESTSLDEAEELKLDPNLLPQAIKIGIGVAAGACLMLALFWGVPSLRSHVQPTANAKSSSLSLAGGPSFQVEVADLSNRRWILRSGGDAGSPFGDTPSRRETSSASSRAESAKSSRSEDTGDSGDAAQGPKSKTPKPGELALSRPRAAAAPAASAQLVAPSIFDGITPPIGSVSDRLAASGPAAPGIVPPESETGIRTSALEAAVLEQRVAPVYPPLALAGRVQGDVLVNATIGTDGIPKDLKVIKGDQRLVAAALAAISKWRYRPAALAGRPIQTETVITVSFQLK